MVSQGFFSGSASTEKRSRRLAGEKENRVALGGDNLGGYGALGIAGSVVGLGIKGIQSAVEGGKRLKENIEKRVNPDRETSFFSPRGNEVARVASSDLSSLRVERPEVRIANVKSYTGSDTKPYSTKDPVYDAINQYDKRKEKSDYQKKIEERNRIAESFGVDPKTGPTYTERDESKFGGELLKSPFPGIKDRYITTKERISGVTDPRYAKESGFTVTPTKFDKGTAFQIGVQLDKNKYGLTPRKVLGEDIGGMYNFKDKDYGESTKAYVAGMFQQESDAMRSEQLRQIDQENNPQNYNEDGSLKTLAQKYDARINLEEKIRKEMGFPSYKEEHKKRIADINTSKDDFGRPLGTMPSMGISAAGRYQAEQNRLQKIKEDSKFKEQRNVIQKVGDAVGSVFNKLTGTQAAQAGVNTSATTNLSRINNVNPTVQKARQAIEKSVRRQTGMSSNPGSQRQTGVGKSAGDLSRHKTGRSTGRGGISKSTSRGQGGSPSSRSRGGVSRGGSKSNTGSKSSARGARGSASSRSRGGTGSGRTSTSRTASKASRSRTGRSRTRCDIRTKINISPLINSNLVKDDLAKLAYFVQEIKK